MIEKIKYWLFQKGKDCRRCCLRCRYYDICRWDVLGNAGLQSEETITLLAIENSKPHKDVYKRQGLMCLFGKKMLIVDNYYFEAKKG